MDDFYERPIFLAVDAQSSTFYIAPCSKKDKIADLIEAYFGAVTEDPTGPYTVRLCDPNDLVGSVYGTEEWFDITYVEDSIARGEQQPLNNYRINNDTPVDFDFGRVLWRKCTWQEAHREIESKHTTPYIQQTDSMDRVSGNTLWKTMERDKVLQNRSWQSMKEHFRKSVAPEIKKGMKYSKILSERAECQMPSSSCYSKDVVESDSAVEPSVDELETERSSADSSSKLEESDAELHNNLTRKQSKKRKKNADQKKSGFREPYRLREDQDIIQYIVNNNSFNLVKGRVMWQEMEAVFRTGRTWQSLTNRYLKHIICHLKNYDITEEHSSQIKKGVQTDQLRAWKNI